MKKRLIISILLLVIALSVSFVSYFLLMSNISLLRDALYDALYTAESTHASYLSAESVVNQWQKSRAVFYIIGFHDDISAIEIDILNLGEFAEYGDKDLFSETCVNCVHKLDSLENANKITIANIL